ncbi:MAG: AIR synthase-related protein [Pseudomonadota bacterium]
MTVFRIELVPVSASPLPFWAHLPRELPIRHVQAYTLTKALSPAQQRTIAERLCPALSHRSFIRYPQTSPDSDYLAAVGRFSWVLEIGFLPGVTDNTGQTARQMIEDHLATDFEGTQGVYTSDLFFLDAELSDSQAHAYLARCFNPLIQRGRAYRAEHYCAKSALAVPQVKLTHRIRIHRIDLPADDEGLLALSSQGIPDETGIPQGGLGLDLPAMKAIRAFFTERGLPPTDAELETLAQTWSEHCKHLIFSAHLDEIENGIYHRYIKRATQEIRAALGDDDFCVSVFHDNAGGIVFDRDWLICDKVETHNSPSALDPFGGAITGIVGVNRDCIGFGLGAKPVLNRYGFCLADPNDSSELYRQPGQKSPLPSAREIAQGVIAGVEAGGNQSGIPTNQGFIYVDPAYRGKPLVFAGTIGLLPRNIAGKPAHEKKARPGDLIVMVGGKVGKDGIHGATFSSQQLDHTSPAGAVQIGDPITQKKMSDALIKELRDQNLYTSITDNGAGGLSSSIGEMAREAGGALVHLDKVPLKYPGLQPWEIWISESQERMTLAVPPENKDALFKGLERHGVSGWVIGMFTDDGHLRARYQKQIVIDLPMDFLHDGVPQKKLTTAPLSIQTQPTPPLDQRDMREDWLAMMSRLNLRGREFIATRLDHEVQAGSVLKPLQGVGRVASHATITRPLLDNPRAIITSQGLFPRYSDLDAYGMAGSAIDAAIRHAIAAGGSLTSMALLDNFCWCSSEDPHRLAQLKQAARACYDYATAYQTPFISGKDSMFNDFSGFDKHSKPIKVSIPPTLLISCVAVLSDYRRAISLDAKIPGDYVYLLGETFDELGGSEYLALCEASGSQAPCPDPIALAGHYRAFTRASEAGLIASALGLDLGGLAACLARTAIAGQCGLCIDLNDFSALSDPVLFFSESAGRILCTVAPDDAPDFEAHLADTPIQRIGTVTQDPQLKIRTATQTLHLPLGELTTAYKTPTPHL